MSATAPTFFAETIEQLKLYVRQTAWLNTVPEKAKKPRRDTVGGSLPQISAGAHLLNILFDLGPVKPMAMSSPVAIDEMDLWAWQFNRHVRLRPFETETIRELSRVYAAQLIEAQDKSCPPPYFPANAIDDERRKKISDAMSGFADKLNAQRKVSVDKNR